MDDRELRVAVLAAAQREHAARAQHRTGRRELDLERVAREYRTGVDAGVLEPRVRFERRVGMREQRGGFALALHARPCELGARAELQPVRDVADMVVRRRGEEPLDHGQRRAGTELDADARVPREAFRRRHADVHEVQRLHATRAGRDVDRDVLAREERVEPHDRVGSRRRFRGCASRHGELDAGCARVRKIGTVRAVDEDDARDAGFEQRRRHLARRGVAVADHERALLERLQRGVPPRFVARARKREHGVAGLGFEEAAHGVRSGRGPSYNGAGPLEAANAARSSARRSRSQA